MSVLVKICGLTTPADAAAAAQAGADYVGVVLASGRLRSRTVTEAAAILAEAPGVRRAGVFVDAPLAEILSVSAALALDVVQLHGAEPPAQVAALRAEGGPRVWKALFPGSAAPALLEDYASSADALLLDGGQGGEGKRFDWGSSRAWRPRLRPELTVVLAGGLSPMNVGRAIATVRPDVVDVSSGVELSPGRKSIDLMAAFMAAARGAGAAG